MTKAIENQEPVPQWRSSQAAIAIGAPLLAGLGSILLTALSYAILPAEVAKETMAPINLSLAAAGGGGSLGGVAGLVKRGLMLTTDRIEQRKAKQKTDGKDGSE